MIGQIAARRLLNVAFLATMPLLQGCDYLDILEPDLAGSYSLVRVDGRRLPVIIDETSRCRVELISASLILDWDAYDRNLGSRSDDGFYELVWAYRETCAYASGNQVRYPLDTETGEFDASGQHIRFYPDDARGDFTGTLRGDELVITGQSSTLTFREDDVR